MKKFFIIFAVVGVAFLLPSKAEAQTKAFMNWYCHIAVQELTNSSYKSVETKFVSYKDYIPEIEIKSNGNYISVRSPSKLYYIKLSNLKYSPSVDEYQILTDIVDSRKYKLVMHSKDGDTTYDIFNASLADDSSEYLMIINDGGKEAVIYDCVGYITLEDMLNLIGIEVRPKTVGLIGSGN